MKFHSILKHKQILNQNYGFAILAKLIKINKVFTHSIYFGIILVLTTFIYLFLK